MCLLRPRQLAETQDPHMPNFLLLDFLDLTLRPRQCHDDCHLQASPVEAPNGDALSVLPVPATLATGAGATLPPNFKFSFFPRLSEPKSAGS
jgi:hypothetical protein